MPLDIPKTSAYSVPLGDTIQTVHLRKKERLHANTPANKCNIFVENLTSQRYKSARNVRIHLPKTYIRNINYNPRNQEQLIASNQWAIFSINLER